MRERMNVGWLICIVALTGGLVGCVDPGGVEVDDVYRLQQAMLERSPQARAQAGLGLMTPVADTVPALPVAQGKDGRTQIKLTLQDAVMRALANSSDIAVVAYDPAIAREQIVQAAAAFDATVFGSMGYSTSDTQFLSDAGVGPGRYLTGSVGVQQRLTTGAQWSITNTMVRSWDDRMTVSRGRFNENDLAFEITQPLLRDAWSDVNLAQLRIAKLNYQVTESQFRQQVETIATEVLNLYYQLVQAREEINIAKRLLEVTKATHTYVVDRKDIDANSVQINQALVAIKQREVVLVNALKQKEDVQDQLVRLLNDPQIQLIQKIDIITTTELPHEKVKFDATDQLLTALRLSPVLEQARLGIQQADITVTVAENQLLPRLDLTLGTTLNGGRRKDMLGPMERSVSGRYGSYQAMLAFEYPIGNRLRRAELAQAKLSKKQVVTQMQNSADQITEAIAERLREIDTAYTRWKLQGETLVAAKEQLAGLELLQELEGSTPEFLNIKLQAQVTVAVTESNLLTALVSYNNAIHDLYRVTGATLELNQVKIAMPLATKGLGH